MPTIKDADNVKLPQPPRTLRSTSGPKAGPKTAAPPPPISQPGKYVEDVERMYARVALGLMPFAPKTSALLVEEITLSPSSEEEPKMRLTHCAEAWDRLAQKNPSVRRMLDKMAQRTPMMEVVELNAPIMMSLAGEMGFFNQVGKLVGKLFSRRDPEPEPEPMQTYGPDGHYVNTEFRPQAV